MLCYLLHHYFTLSCAYCKHSRAILILWQLSPNKLEKPSLQFVLNITKMSAFESVKKDVCLTGQFC